MSKLPLPGNHLPDVKWPKPPKAGVTGPPIVLPGGKRTSKKAALKAYAQRYAKAPGSPD